MTKQKKLEELKRWFHISKAIQKENLDNIYSKGFQDGAQFAYIQVIEMLMTKAEKKDMYDWLWDV